MCVIGEEGACEFWNILVGSCKFLSNRRGSTKGAALLLAEMRRLTMASLSLTLYFEPIDSHLCGSEMFEVG